MQSERYDSIEYNDEWDSIPVVRAEPLNSNYDYDSEAEEDDYEEDYDTYSGQSDGYINFEDRKPKKTEGIPQPVIKLQFLLAFVALAAAFILKIYGGDLYTTVSQWYFNNLNDSLIVTMKSQNDTSFSEVSTENNISETDITEQPTESTISPDDKLIQPTSALEEALDEETSDESNLEDSSEEVSNEIESNTATEEEDEY